jgi:hypothetical protein
MTDATELDIDAIRARVEAATDGPWRFSNTTDTRGRKGEFRAPSPHNGFMLVGPWTNNADAEFIAHARTDLPAALDEITRLRAALDEATRHRDRLLAGFFASCPDNHEHGIWCGSAWVALTARAEAAESALADVRALADEWKAAVTWDGRIEPVARAYGQALRAALAAPTTTERSEG